MPVFGQNQRVADSLKQLVEGQRVVDSLYLEQLKLIAINETDPLVAEQYADRLIAVAAVDSLYWGLLSGYLQKGNADRLQGNLEEALTSFFKSLEYAQKLEDRVSVGALHASIADVYSVSGNSVNATLYYDRSISILRQINDSLKLATALLNCGDEYFNQEKYDRALQYFEESGDIFQQLDHLIGTAYTLGNIGMVYASVGQPDLAERTIIEAVEILDSLQDYYPISVYLTYMSDIYLERGDPSEALDYAHRSLEMARQYGLKDQISGANLQLSRVHEQMGNPVEALNFYKEYITYRDSVSDIETIKNLANIRTDYEISQKQMEVDLLNQQKRNQQIIVIATVIALLLIGLLAFGLYRRNQYIQKTNRIIEREKKNSERLLLNILPEETAIELREHGKVKAKRYDSVTVLFADFKGFTRYAENLSPEELVESLDFYFSRFDEIIKKYNLEKIKTVGDAYMCAGGLPEPTGDHPSRMVLAAFEMAAFVEKAKKSITSKQTRFEVRIGINTGPVVAGVVGTQKIAYDIWGDTVNIASRMESNSEAGKINISEHTYELIKDRFSCTYRGEIKVKNRGRLKMYFVEPPGN